MYIYYHTEEIHSEYYALFVILSVVPLLFVILSIVEGSAESKDTIALITRFFTTFRMTGREQGQQRQQGQQRDDRENRETTRQTHTALPENSL